MSMTDLPKPMKAELVDYEADFATIESAALKLDGVQYAFAQKMWNIEPVCLYVIARDHVSRADLDTLKAQVLSEVHEHASGYYNTINIRVVPVALFNKAIRATLSRNFELEAEMRRIRELTPDVDSALRVLNVIVKEPDIGLPLFEQIEVKP